MKCEGVVPGSSPVKASVWKIGLGFLQKSLTVSMYLRNAPKKDSMKTVKGYLKGTACVSLHGSLSLSGTSKRLGKQFYILVSGFARILVLPPTQYQRGCLCL